jgi:hypothetical protein
MTNIIGHYKRAVTLAALGTFSSTDIFVGAYTFLQSQAPQYVTGYSICIAGYGFAIIFSVLYGVLCWWENRQRDLGKRDYLRAVIDQEELGDRHVRPFLFND